MSLLSFDAFEWASEELLEKAEELEAAAEKRRAARQAAELVAGKTTEDLIGALASDVTKWAGLPTCSTWLEQVLRQLPPRALARLYTTWKRQERSREDRESHLRRVLDLVRSDLEEFLELLDEEGGAEAFRELVAEVRRLHEVSLDLQPTAFELERRGRSK